MAIVARKMDRKLDPFNFAAHTLRQRGYIDMERQGVSSWCIEMTGRWSSKKCKVIYISADWKDIAKLGGFSVSTLLDQIKSQLTDDWFTYCCKIWLTYEVWWYFKNDNVGTGGRIIVSFHFCMNNPFVHFWSSDIPSM